jgi:hypothetical protein
MSWNDISSPQRSCPLRARFVFFDVYFTVLDEHVTKKGISILHAQFRFISTRFGLARGHPEGVITGVF